MNAWTWAAVALCAGLLLCLGAGMTGGAFRRLIALQLAGVLAALAVLALAEGLDRTFLQDLSLGLAVTSLPGTLAVVRWLGRLS